MPRTIEYLSVFLLAGLAVAAQPQAAQTAGVESEWDLRTQLKRLSEGARRLQPIVEQADPKNWRDQQAAQSYAPQWRAAQNEIRYLTGVTDQLSKDPERLTLVLETFFRMQAVEFSVSAVVEGLRKYSNPAVGDLLEGALVEHKNNRERLKTYMVDLAQTKEQEFAIMDKEAQRCRAFITKQPPQPPAAAKPRSK